MCLALAIKYPPTVLETAAVRSSNQQQYGSRNSSSTFLEAEYARTTRDQIPIYGFQTSSYRVLETATVGFSNQNLPVQLSNVCV